MQERYLIDTGRDPGKDGLLTAGGYYGSGTDQKHLLLKKEEDREQQLPTNSRATLRIGVGATTCSRGGDDLVSCVGINDDVFGDDDSMDEAKYLSED